MASLLDLVDNSRTDKNTSHTYLEVYDTLFEKKKLTARHILEIGIFEGGSIQLWHDFFPNATVYGVDIMQDRHVWPRLKEQERIVLHTGVDAYNEAFFQSEIVRPWKYDILIDDGPHTLESMALFLSMYSHRLAEDGILVIEDVKSLVWCDILRNQVPQHLQPYVKVFDRRALKNRQDDILFVIDRCNNTL